MSRTKEFKIFCRTGHAERLAVAFKLTAPLRGSGSLEPYWVPSRIKREPQIRHLYEGDAISPRRDVDGGEILEMSEVLPQRTNGVIDCDACQRRSGRSTRIVSHDEDLQTVLTQLAREGLTHVELAFFHQVHDRVAQTRRGS